VQKEQRNKGAPVEGKKKKISFKHNVGKKEEKNKGEGGGRVKQQELKYLTGGGGK